MLASVDTLVSNLEKDQFNNMKMFYDGKKLNLLLRKRVYPNDYIDSISQLNEKNLPPRDVFFSKLNNAPTPITDYKHAQENI